MAHVVWGSCPSSITDRPTLKDQAQLTSIHLALGYVAELCSHYQSDLPTGLIVKIYTMCKRRSILQTH